MRKQHFIGLALLGLVLTSCGDTKKEPVTEPAPQIEATSNEVTETPVATETVDNTSNEALNPAHGQPGHRCEIPVGAPLSSAPGAQATNLPNQGAPAGDNKPFLVNDAAKQQMGGAKSASSGQINPPHGQPGHDCAVPVGQPLP